MFFRGALRARMHLCALFLICLSTSANANVLDCVARIAGQAGQVAAKVTGKAIAGLFRTPSKLPPIRNATPAKLRLEKLDDRVNPSITYDFSVYLENYSSGNPAANVDVEVLSPEGDGVLYGTTDAGGYFWGSFERPNDYESYTYTDYYEEYVYDPYYDEYVLQYTPYDVYVPGQYTESVTVNYSGGGFQAAYDNYPVDFGTYPYSVSISTSLDPATVIDDPVVVTAPTMWGSLEGAYGPVAVGAGGQGYAGQPQITVFDSVGNQVASIVAFPGFTGEVRTALGDVDGDGVLDIAAAAGPGGGPHLRIFNGATGLLEYDEFVYDGRFHGGFFVAMGDVDGDGLAEVVTGADAGGGPHTKVINPRTHQTIWEFMAYAPNFTGGVRVAVGDVNGDGKADVITGAGAGGGPHVYAYDVASQSVITTFFAYAPEVTAGVYVAAGDLNGDGIAEIVTGVGAGFPSHVRAWDVSNPAVEKVEVASFYAYDQSWLGGVRVAVEDGKIVTGPGSGGGPHLRSRDINGVEYFNFFTGFGLQDDSLFGFGLYPN